GRVPSRSGLKGCAPVGTNPTSSRSNSSATSLAATRCPWWIGSNVPPMMPTREGARSARIIGRLGNEFVAPGPSQRLRCRVPMLRSANVPSRRDNRMANATIPKPMGGISISCCVPVSAANTSKELLIDAVLSPSVRVRAHGPTRDRSFLCPLVSHAAAVRSASGTLRTAQSHLTVAQRAELHALLAVLRPGLGLLAGGEGACGEFPVGHHDADLDVFAWIVHQWCGHG